MSLVSPPGDPSWWTAYAHGPRRDREFYFRVRQRERELKRAVPEWQSDVVRIPSGARCEGCGGKAVSAIPSNAPYAVVLGGANPMLRADPNLYYCSNCLVTDVFPAIDRFHGNDFTTLLKDFNEDGMQIKLNNTNDDTQNVRIGGVSVKY